MSQDRTPLQRDLPAAGRGGPSGPHITVPATEKLSPVRADNRAAAMGLTMAEAEHLLDWLEAHGHHDVQLTSEPGGTFTVSWLST